MMGSEYAHILLNLLAVIALLVVIFYVARKMKLNKYSENKKINIINAVSIGSKEKIILLEVNNAILLIGATPTQIATLHVFEEGDSIRLTAESKVTQEPTFAEHLTNALN